MPLLHAESHPDHTVTITISGAVAYQSPDQIRGAVRAAIVRWTPRVVLLDVADVTLLEVATIAALLSSHQVGERAGVPVALINVGVFPLSQLRERGLLTLLCPHLLPRDVDAAVAVEAPSSPPAKVARGRFHRVGS